MLLDAYFCGHDHSLQHIFNAELTGLHHFVSGSGSGSMWYPVSKIPNYTVWNQAIGGFANVIINDGMMEVQFIKENGDFLYSSGKIAKRSRPIPTNVSGGGCASSTNNSRTKYILLLLVCVVCVWWCVS